ncbi:DUF368 domain-containing protein [bacterium]|nr:DUF368 domain-containing protein [Candidatus Omnitrophota bacterium]MBU2527955.1 DUF368 domain-containing protein [bacterium]MBU3930150.1 DUF368 domain-containing protein [bacterium]MBU4122726.1 DUF368 domain-containing protein [bacterium]
MINIFKGFLIGIANLIPGVSGGTFALILGIYERLVRDINRITFKNISALCAKGRLREAFNNLDGVFIISLGAGAFLSIVSLAPVIDWCLKNQPSVTLAFFGGLIIPSLALPIDRVRDRGFKNAIFALPGIALVLFVYLWGPAGSPGDFSLITVFVCGALATSAMILPGISGSFILLVIGIYGTAIGHIKTFFSGFTFPSFVFLSVFALGCVVGIVAAARLIKYLFEKYKDRTLFFLVGLILGSLTVLWPFKDYSFEEPGKVKTSIAAAKNTLPSSAKEAVYPALFFMLGIAGALMLNRIEKNSSPHED